MSSPLIREILRDKPHFLLPMGYPPAATSAYDLSRRGRNAVQDNGITPYPAPRGMGRASSVGGQNNVTLSAANLPALTGSFTIGMWIRAIYTGTTITVVSDAVGEFFNYFNRPTSGRITAYFGASNESEALVTTGDPPWNDGRWHQIHWLRDTGVSPVRLSFWIDGRLDSSRSEVGAAPAGNADILCGGGIPSGQDGSRMSCITAYGYVLSPARIKAQYRAGMRMGVRTRAA